MNSFVVFTNVGVCVRMGSVGTTQAFPMVKTRDQLGPCRERCGPMESGIAKVIREKLFENAPCRFP
eukprot:5361281-Amphidinium_carterae.1